MQADKSRVRQASKSRVRQASARSPSPTQSRGAVRSLHSKGKFIAGHMQNIPDDANPGSEQRGKTEVGALTWTGRANSNSCSLKPTLPGAAVADFRVTTGDTRTMHRSPEAAAFPAVSLTRKPFYPISVKYSLHPFHVLWDSEGQCRVSACHGCTVAEYDPIAISSIYFKCHVYIHSLIG